MITEESDEQEPAPRRSPSPEPRGSIARRRRLGSRAGRRSPGGRTGATVARDLDSLSGRAGRGSRVSRRDQPRGGRAARGHGPRRERDGRRGGRAGTTPGGRTAARVHGPRPTSSPDANASASGRSSGRPPARRDDVVERRPEAGRHGRHGRQRTILRRRGRAWSRPAGAATGQPEKATSPARTRRRPGRRLAAEDLRCEIGERPDGRPGLGEIARPRRSSDRASPKSASFTRSVANRMFDGFTSRWTSPARWRSASRRRQRRGSAPARPAASGGPAQAIGQRSARAQLHDEERLATGDGSPASTSNTATTPGWRRRRGTEPRARTGPRSRSPARFGRRTLTATSRSSRSSRARWTVAMPPDPSSARIRYRPVRTSPGWACGRDYPMR